MSAKRSRREQWKEFVEEGKTSQRSRVSILPVGTKFCGRVLGIDPSLRGTGMAVIDVKADQNFDLIFSETLKIQPKKTLLECTAQIFSKISEVIKTFSPDVCAAEQTIYVQNFQTAQIMGIARGAVLAAIGLQHLEVFEYAPLRIKQAVCGYGRASKEQVSKMVQALLKTKLEIGFDETDAAAAALCHSFTARCSDGGNNIA